MTLGDPQVQPAPWLLDAEPDLTADQVWLVLATAGQAEVKVFREAVAIADTAEQAMTAIGNHQWNPLVALNETTLESYVTLGQAAPAAVVNNLLGQPGTQRFVLVFAAPENTPPVRLVWVLAAHEHLASHAWRALGESEEPLLVLRFADFLSAHETVKTVRLNRGRGAMVDGRPFEDSLSRWCALEAQALPGGVAQFEANVSRLHAVRLRAQERLRAAAGSHHEH